MLLCFEVFVNIWVDKKFRSEFDHFKFQGGGRLGAKMRPTIETKCCHALLCLLTFRLIKISDQCDFDHFRFQIPLFPLNLETKN